MSTLLSVIPYTLTVLRADIANHDTSCPVFLTVWRFAIPLSYGVAIHDSSPNESFYRTSRGYTAMTRTEMLSPKMGKAL
ncbi:MAG: hypothetical protein IJ587_00215 [Synergistaceae bacterium]|nr:hypothetical protein [Synergistaceae bacterium]